ncbi:uncharacterized protein [Nicotiana tomentosiformis]|uniref:uncharacterized protein n=1 Tax=Nicotiana tomentosiformis TaxID=4098 RepID=UPI00388CA342
MKGVMKKRFVADYFQEDILSKFYTLRQGSKNVDEFFEEFEKTRLRANFYDREDLIVPRFLAGLNKEISSPIRLHKYDYLEDAYQATLRSYHCNGGYQIGDSDHDEDVEEESESDHGECEEEYPKCYLVVRRLIGALAKEELDQRENHFHARCKIMGDVCSMIIDNGSCANVASASLVEQLNFPTRKSPTPYRLQWLNECGELKVTKLVLIKFKIGKYHDEVWCDVVPMQACHLLLGRPWQYDREAKHDGRTNKYSLVKDRYKFTLLSLTPFQVNEDYKKNKRIEGKSKE